MCVDPSLDGRANAEKPNEDGPHRRDVGRSLYIPIQSKVAIHLIST
jgi:hypothetical protein